MKKTYLEWNQEDIRRCELKDTFFLYIKYNPYRDIETIAQEHSASMKKMSIDKDALYELLSGLIADDKLSLSANGTYILHPAALYFPGFLIQYLQSRKKERKKDKKEFLLRALPILLTVIFGLTTFYFNAQSSKRNKELQIKVRQMEIMQKTIDSLSQSARRKRSS